MSIEMSVSCDTCEASFEANAPAHVECTDCRKETVQHLGRALELLEDLFRGAEYPALRGDVAAFLKEHGQ
jgi:hypothetical protein